MQPTKTKNKNCSFLGNTYEVKIISKYFYILLNRVELKKNNKYIRNSIKVFFVVPMLCILKKMN